MENFEEMKEFNLYSADAEQAVLGCMLAQPQEVIDETTTLDRDDFFVPSHKEIFAVLQQMHGKKKAIDMTTVHQELVDRKIAEQMGSPGLLAELLNGFATHLNVGSYIQILREKAILRRLQSACMEIVKSVGEEGDDIQGLLERAQNRINGIGTSDCSTEILSAKACVARFRDQRDKIQRGDVQNCLKTGLRGLDEGNGGLPIPGYVVIAGEEGVGKSALVLNILRHACESTIPTGCFSLEMTIEQIIQREVANIARMNSRRMNHPLHPREQEDVELALQQIEQWPFWIDPTPGLTPSDLKIRVRKMVKDGAKIIWLDNFQLTRGSNDRDKRVDQLMEVSRTIQWLTKEYDILFILLAQVTRDGQKRGGLKTYDLADCASVSRDARVILMLERKEGHETCTKSAIPIIGRVVKYSEGETGDIELTLNAYEQRIQ